MKQPIEPIIPKAPEPKKPYIESTPMEPIQLLDEPPQEEGVISGEKINETSTNEQATPVIILENTSALDQENVQLKIPEPIQYPKLPPKNEQKSTSENIQE